MKQLTGAIVFLFLLSGCAAYKLDSAQTQLRNSFASGDYESTAELIETLDQNEIYKSKDQVLVNLEHGLVNHFAGNYESSSQYFTEAENEIDDLFTKSVTRAIQSFAVNDNALAYDGEDYEDIYLNVFKGLNYIHRDELESALVEIRRVSYKLGQLDQKYNGLIEALSKADTTSTDKDKWKTGQTNVQNSAMGRYLSTILYAKTGKPDDARIELENLYKAYREQPSVYSFKMPGDGELRTLTEPDSYNILIQAFAGRAPIKKQNDIRFYFDETDTYLKFSLPTLHTYHSRVRNIRVKVNNNPPKELYLVEEMDQVAKEVYKVKEPIIYARSLVRAVLKAGAAEGLKNRAAKESDALGIAANILGKIAQETTEKADLRSWQTMPGKAYSTVLNLPPGTHQVEVQYLDASGRIINRSAEEVHIDENTKLELVESIFWN
ncbi:COG3014 family protein [Gracilimonas tropica]|uniref:COG3014 family protein n=1 Tax=Gracilimonas tropica TaxID=454600 RepID=UPI00037A28C6|nr:hypothetical protein [Gracilimonas tropica]